jgi:Mrp family chromosome partitioning ATPase
MIARSPKVNFDYLSAGKIPPNPTELLSSARLAILLKELEGRYDHVIVDAPPILGLADVPLLTAAVEGVILIIRANGAKLRAINSAVDRIRATGAHLFGGIVTQLDYRNAAYGYGYGHGYGYGYGRNKLDKNEAASGA